MSYLLSIGPLALLALRILHQVPYVLLAAAPLLKLVRFVLHRSYDGSTILGDNRDLQLSLLRLYFMLFTLVKTSHEDESGEDVLQLRASVVLDSIAHVVEGMVCPALDDNHLKEGFEEHEYRTTVSQPALELLLTETMVAPSRFLPGLQLLTKCLGPLSTSLHPRLLHSLLHSLCSTLCCSLGATLCPTLETVLCLGHRLCARCSRVLPQYTSIGRIGPMLASSTLQSSMKSHRAKSLL